MPSGEAAAQRRADLLLTLAVSAALMSATIPLLRVVDPGPWQPGAFLLASAILLGGYIARARRLPSLTVTLIELAIWVLSLTAAFLRTSAFLWVIPTPLSLREVQTMVMSAMNDIITGAAPLPAETALTFVLVGSVGLLAIVLDHVVLTARMPLLACVGLVAVWLIPAIAVPRSADVVAFVVFAVAILFLLRIETRGREVSTRRGASARRGTGVGATAIGVGAIAVVVAVAVTPLLPAPTMRADAGGFGAATTIDPSLELGDDLRQPRSVRVLTVRSDAPLTPYLRAATLSTFDGEVWEPDRVRTLPLASEFGLGEVDVADEVRLTEYRTTIDVANLVSPWLPVAYPAVRVEGLDGDWAAMPYNRTVVSEESTSEGEDYLVVTHVPKPSLEQIRAATAGGPGLRDETRRLPDALPPVIAETAAAITADAATDYDKLIALQNYFRGPNFTYSLEAPVEDGFDGSGVDAIAEFLDRREGYCVHFASAFAVMARLLDMPSRIVIGYLPGTSTNDSIDDQTVYEVSSDQLHAWPEVYFDGIGWVAFEPTKSLGVPTSFSSASSTQPDGGQDVTPGDAASPTPTPTASAGPLAGQRPDDDASGAPTVRTFDPAPTLALLLSILVVAALPAMIRTLRWRMRVAAAARGDARAAWLGLREVVIDLGVDEPASETPRVLGARLVSRHEASADAMHILVAAIERAAYAPAAPETPGAPGDAHEEGPALARALTRVRADMLDAVSPRRRLRALVLPRSLAVRPGSAYAG